MPLPAPRTPLGPPGRAPPGCSWPRLCEVGGGAVCGRGCCRLCPRSRVRGRAGPEEGSFSEELEAEEREGSPILDGHRSRESRERGRGRWQWQGWGRGRRRGMGGARRKGWGEGVGSGGKEGRGQEELRGGWKGPEDRWDRSG